MKLKNMNLKKLLLSLLLLVFVSKSWAVPIVVRDIRVEGLQGIKKQTVLNYLPVKPGQRWNTDQSAEAIRALYASGLFEDVSIDYQGDTLIVHVLERNFISSVMIFGSDAIPKEQSDAVLKEIGLVQGNVLKPNMISDAKQIFEAEYVRLGKENATVNVVTKPMGNHRVAVEIQVNEGKLARVQSIQFIGNQHANSMVLLYKMKLSTWSLLNYFTHSNEFTQDKLEASKDAIKQYYLDRGYVRFRFDEVQTNFTPDHKKVSIVLKMTEGERYRLKGYELTGNLILPEAELRKKITTLHIDDYYSQEDIDKAIEEIGDAVGDRGYGYAQVTSEPIIDDNTKQVVVRFKVVPGPQLYVRQIRFSGNYQTSEIVLRRSLRQEEGSLMSTSKIKESERQLRVLGYFDKVDVKTRPVPGTNNQVDLDFNVNELPGAEAIFAVGYGTEGPVGNINLNQSNFLGSGQSVGIGFKMSSVQTAYNFNYFNPYFTEKGIGMGFDAFYETTDPAKVNVARYTTDQFGGNLYWLYPLTDVKKLKFGLGYADLEIKNLGSNPAIQLQDFVDKYGKRFREAKVFGSWIYNSYDKVPYPTSGLRQQLDLTLNAPASSNSLTYYKTQYAAHWYYPLGYLSGFIFNTKGTVGYSHGLGNTKSVPFYDNYLAGGIIEPGTVRGFENFSLGPRDSKDDPMGGNFIAAGSIGLIFPNMVSRDKLRTQVFVDVGNVYNKGGTEFTGTDPGPMRFSTGLGIDWYSPLGPITFSIAKPLNKQDGDRQRIFDFTIAVPL